MMMFEQNLLSCSSFNLVEFGKSYMAYIVNMVYMVYVAYIIYIVHIYGISGIYVKYGICGIYGKYGWTQLFYCMLFEVFLSSLTFGIVIFCMNSVVSYNIVS